MVNVVRIENFDDPRLDVFARLTETQIRHPQKGPGMFIAESPKVIERALDDGYKPISLLMEEKHIHTQAKHVIERCGDIPVFTSTTDVLEKLTGYKLTRGVLCAMERKPLPKSSDILKSSSRIAVLKNIMNPTNVGAIFRSAAALGMDAVLLTEDCSDPLYRRSVRVSMGTVFQIPWTVIGSLEELKAYGFKSTAMALRDNSLDIRDIRDDKVAIILGSEGDGLPEEVIEQCDYTVKIPMYHGVDSLNVAAASAVAFFALRNNYEKNE